MRILALLAALTTIALAQEPGEPVAAAMADLRDDDYRVREAAMERLEALGERAVPALEEAARSGDPDLSRRAKILVQAIRLRQANREGIWETLVSRSPWGDTLAFAGATIRFYVGDAGSPAAWWIVHGSGEPILSQEELPVALDGLSVRIGERSFTFDRWTGTLHDAACVAGRLVPQSSDENRVEEDLGSAEPLRRREALWTAIRSREGLTEPRLIELLDDDDPEVRAYAAYAAGWLHVAPARGSLRDRLADEDARVRREAAEAIGREGVAEDRPRLEALLEDEDENVRAHAREAIEDLERRFPSGR